MKLPDRLTLTTVITRMADDDDSGRWRYAIALDHETLLVGYAGCLRDVFLDAEQAANDMQIAIALRTGAEENF